jgi:hypothetical protein
MYVFCRLLFVLFLSAIVLSVLRFTDSDYPFGIFKLFMYPIYVMLLITGNLKHIIFHVYQQTYTVDKNMCDKYDGLNDNLPNNLYNR